MPNVVILAGPNGAGKTSVAPLLLRDTYRVVEFVNADVIARGLSAFSAASADAEAGRIMLRRLDELAHANEARCFRDIAILDRAMRIAVARVIRRHRLLNQPLVAGRDGNVVELDPHTVPMPEGVTEEQMGPVFDYL
jgi:predicted ATPase